MRHQPFAHLFMTVLVLAFLAACASRLELPQPNGPLGLDADDHFLIDFLDSTVTPLGDELMAQTFYRPNRGVAFRVRVLDRVLGAPGLYSVRVDITNRTGQTILAQGIDPAQLIATGFKTRNASGRVVPGGAVTNAAGYKAESGYPFVVVSQDIAPGATRSVVIDVSLPAGATRATFGLRLLATSAGSNNIPGPENGWVTALVGKHWQSGNVGGPAHLARLFLPSGLAACDGVLYIADQDGFAVKRYRNNVLSDHTSSGLNGVRGMDCLVGSGLDDRLVVADASINRIKFLSLEGGVAETVGSSAFGVADGAAATAQFGTPRDVAVLGHSVFVADTLNRAIRRLDRRDGNWVVSTVVSGLPGRPNSITSDGVSTLYFTLAGTDSADSGVYRLPLGSSTPTRIYRDGGLNFNSSSLRWNGGSLVLGSVENSLLYRLTPTLDPDLWQGVKLAGTGGGSVGGGMRAKDAPIFTPLGLAVDRSGTLYVASLGRHQVLKIDLRR